MKFKSFLLAHKPLVKDIVVGTCLVGASAGVIFGISAGMFKVEYMKLEGAEARLEAFKNHNYTSENIVSAWNMNGGKTADGKDIPAIEAPKYPTIRGVPEAEAWWHSLHGDNATPLWHKYNELQMDKVEGDLDGYNAYEQRYKYGCIVIDGATHTTMDRSFNQSLYQGLVDFIHNERCDHCDPETGSDPKAQFIAKSFKPSQDNTTDFINTYVSAMRDYDVLGLAGFNHATPLNAMMVHKDNGGTVDPLASNADPEINKIANSTGFVLLDSNVNCNQNVASVQFRADQPGFLAALATCQYLYNNLDVYHKNHEDLAVAAFGGVAIPTVTIYIGGFQRGIEFFNKKILMSAITSPTFTHGGILFYFQGVPGVWEYDYDKVQYETFMNLLEHSKYKDGIEEIKNDASLNVHGKINKFRELYEQKMYDEFSIKMIKLGDFDTHFTGTFAAGDAIGITKQYLNRGASAIIAVAGPQSLDAAQEIQNQNSKAFVIGVDSAMEDGDYQRWHKGCSEATRGQRIESDPYVDRTILSDGSFSEEANAIIKFSGIKDIRSVSKKITRLCAEGKNWDIDAYPWDHSYAPKWEDAHILNEEDVIYKTQSTGVNTVVTISGLKNGVSLDGVKQLVIPNEWISTDLADPIKMDYESIKFADGCFSGKLNDVEDIKFNNRVLTFGANSFKMNPDSSRIHYIDFSTIGNVNDVTVEDNAFAGWPSSENGILGFSASTLNNEQKKAVSEALATKGLSSWYQVKPSPYKSVCTTGFQTCSNILNGLISISWDGFIPMMQALSHLSFNIAGALPQGGLTEAWAVAADWYFDELPDLIKEEIDDEYLDNADVLNNFATYNKKYTEDQGDHKKGEPTIYYQNYNHTMGILGKLLSIARLAFDRDMSLIPDGNGGFKIMDGDNAEMTILDWLDYNMYMMS